MGRGLMIPGFVGKNIEKWLQAGDLPKSVSKYGSTVEEIFVCYEELKEKFGPQYEGDPNGCSGCLHLRVQVPHRPPAAYGRQQELPGLDHIAQRPDGTHRGRGRGTPAFRTSWKPGTTRPWVRCWTNQQQTHIRRKKAWQGKVPVLPVVSLFFSGSGMENILRISNEILVPSVGWSDSIQRKNPTRDGVGRSNRKLPAFVCTILSTVFLPGSEIDDQLVAGEICCKDRF